MGGNRDHARRSDRQQRQRQPVVTAVHHEVGITGEEACRGGWVPAGVLDPDDVVALRPQGEDGLGGNLPAGPHRDVVEDHRELRGSGDRCEVTVQSGLRGSVVVRRHRQDALRTKPRCLLHEPHRVLGVVRGHAGEDRGPRVGHRFDHRPDEVEALRVGEDRRLAGRAGDAEGVGAVGHEVAGELAGRIEVQCSPLVERRHHGRDDTAEEGLRCGAHDLNLAAGSSPDGSSEHLVRGSEHVGSRPRGGIRAVIVHRLGALED